MREDAEKERGIPFRNSLLKWTLIALPAIVILFAFGLVYYLNKFDISSEGPLFDKVSKLEEFKCAISQVQKDEKAVNLLGSPIKNGTDIDPATEIFGPERRVNFRITVSGSKSDGKLRVFSHRTPFISRFQMILEKDGEEISLYEGTYPCGEDRP
ncbi:MAG: cytochrome c oxidase assembly factor Coa1 family protein [Pyrinomonadaceae bacterium]